MFINVNKIGPEGLRIDRRLELAELEGGQDERIRIVQASMRGEARRGGSGVDLTARLEARVQLECSRCLESFEIAIEADFFLIIVAEAVEYGVGESEINEEDAYLFYAPEGKAELDLIAAEQILLHLPLKPVCDADCKGLCPTCGADRNQIECGCRSEAIDPRLAPLLDLRK
jgi:uncharacterized protein